MSNPKENSGYNDLYFRIILALLAAHIIVAFGAKQTFFELLLMWRYYRSLLLSFAIAFLLINEVYFITARLDKRYAWKVHMAERIGLQFILGLILPSITAFFLAMGYYAIYGYNILETYYLRFDFPVIVIMILLLNVYYLAFYFYRQWQITENKIIATRQQENSKTKEVFVVHHGAKNIPLPVEMISYFYHDGNYNFIRTRDREDFIISQALDELQQQLNDRQFFRVNRQMLVNFTACRHFEPLEFGKLELFVTPTTKEPIIISQKRAKAFKEWIAR